MSKFFARWWWAVLLGVVLVGGLVWWAVSKTSLWDAAMSFMDTASDAMNDRNKSRTKGAQITGHELDEGPKFGEGDGLAESGPRRSRSE